VIDDLHELESPAALAQLQLLLDQALAGFLLFQRSFLRGTGLGGAIKGERERSGIAGSPQRERSIGMLRNQQR
jgi:hypothetical protein